MWSWSPTTHLLPDILNQCLIRHIINNTVISELLWGTRFEPRLKGQLQTKPLQVLRAGSPVIFNRGHHWDIPNLKLVDLRHTNSLAKNASGAYQLFTMVEPHMKVCKIINLNGVWLRTWRTYTDCHFIRPIRRSAITISYQRRSKIMVATNCMGVCSVCSISAVPHPRRYVTRNLMEGMLHQYL
jgi:hypothetical protein